MFTTPIQPILPLQTTLSGLERTASTSEDKGNSMFADIFKAAIQDVKDTDAEKNRAEYLLATGQLDNPAELTLAGTKAQTSVELLVQLRTKALEAYNELMRISI